MPKEGNLRWGGSGCQLGEQGALLLSPHWAGSPSVQGGCSLSMAVKAKMPNLEQGEHEAFPFEKEDVHSSRKLTWLVILTLQFLTMRPWENYLPFSSVSFLICKTWIITIPTFLVNELHDTLKVVWKCLLVDALYKVGWQGECPLRHGIGKRMSGSHWAGGSGETLAQGKGAVVLGKLYGTSSTWIRS